jgi:hypothetical protein
MLPIFVKTDSMESELEIKNDKQVYFNQVKGVITELNYDLKYIHFLKIISFLIQLVPYSKYQYQIKYFFHPSICCENKSNIALFHRLLNNFLTKFYILRIFHLNCP